MQKWSPKGTERPRTAKRGSRADSRGPKKSKPGDDQLLVDPESGPELKEAFEVTIKCIKHICVQLNTLYRLISNFYLFS